MSFAVAFDFQSREETAIPPAEAAAWIARGRFCWLDLDLDDGDDLRAILIGLGFDGAAAAKAAAPEEETAYEVLPGALCFGLSEASYENGTLRTAAVRVWLNERALVTAHRGPVEFLRRMAETYREDFVRFSRSHGFLLYELGDSLLEIHRRSRRRFAVEVERLHENLLAASDDQVFSRVAALTRRLLQFRKIALDGAETLHELATRKSPVVPESTQPHLRATADAVQRIGEDLTVHRDTLNDAVNLYLSAVSHHTNRIVKRLTIVGTIFMPLTFLCGVYGMNMFIPEAEWKWIYLVFWLVCLATVVILLGLMRRWKWL